MCENCMDGKDDEITVADLMDALRRSVARAKLLAAQRDEIRLEDGVYQAVAGVSMRDWLRNRSQRN